MNRRHLLAGTVALVAVAATSAVGLTQRQPVTGEVTLCDDPAMRKMLIRVRIQNLRTEIQAYRDAMPNLTLKQRARAREAIALLRAQIADLRDALDDCDPT